MQERILWCMPQGQISLVDGNLSETRLGFETVMSSDARETSMDASNESPRSPRSPFDNQELASTAPEHSKEVLASHQCSPLANLIRHLPTPTTRSETSPPTLPGTLIWQFQLRDRAPRPWRRPRHHPGRLVRLDLIATRQHCWLDRRQSR